MLRMWRRASRTRFSRRSCYWASQPVHYFSQDRSWETRITSQARSVSGNFSRSGTNCGWTAILPPVPACQVAASSPVQCVTKWVRPNPGH